ncbi:MAG TPA: PRC-barrel domain-containing protein [Nitrolancea sp.]|jgi:uncharacterized protein YrrD|nr:PRC-barrel domain-containing protein [Nitrolancea sp.]
MKASDISGMTVVSLQEGAKLGQVDQPLFDLGARQLRALHVKGVSGISVLPFDQIENIGSDAITVVTSQITQTPGADSVGQGLLDLHTLRKLKIVDRDGTFLGTLSEIEFDPMSGQVTQLTAHKGGVLGVGGTTTAIDITANLIVGAELLTVNSNVVNSTIADSDTVDSSTTNSSTVDSATVDAVPENLASKNVTTETTDSPRPPLSPNDPSSADAEAEIPSRRY